MNLRTVRDINREVKDAENQGRNLYLRVTNSGTTTDEGLWLRIIRGWVGRRNGANVTMAVSVQGIRVIVTPESVFDVR